MDETVAMHQPAELLFVYGSLKRGQRHHDVLEGALFAGPARTLPECRLLDLGDYPALASGDRSIEGEVFEVSRGLLRRLDLFEGAEYERRALRLADGRSAQSYFAVESVAARSKVLDSHAWPLTAAPPARG
jgi:gamma-glutamylcyclotransferase (GGCT)/AIG2-like uncharacterized protein YtfP